MQWTRILISIGVLAGASFTISNEAQYLLSSCVFDSQDWFARLALLIVLFVMHSFFLLTGFYLVLILRLPGNGILKSIIELFIIFVVAYAISLCIFIIDNAFSYLISTVCNIFQSCSQPSFTESFRRAAYQAANWSNAPEASFIGVMFTGAVILVKKIAIYERKVIERNTVA